MEPVLAIREYLEYVVLRLILHPEEAGVSHEEKEGRHLFRIRLHPDDAGRVIGRNGRTIAAIRCLALASAEKHDLQIAVELDEAARDAG
ncbi:MAG: KH domain-containing protein [Verrucomicrobiaceae bacterium]|nr:KH domain-containing protein [Verrucomicrobiaceae bacterium]